MKNVSYEKIAILGGGSWGTAIARLLAEKVKNVSVWDIDKKNVELVEQTRENKKYLPGVFIQRNIHFSTDIEGVLRNASIILLVFPSKAVRQTLKKIKKYLQKTQILVNLIKGFEQGTLRRVSEIVAEELGEVPYAVLSGPSHAEEVAYRMPTAVVVASKDAELAAKLQQLFTNDYFRVYTSEDVVGVEIGGSVKNVIAIAAGISDGLGFGSNTKAALMTRGLHEIIRFAQKFDANILTFMGLSGIGDLITTCISPYSRNRRFGELLGRGYDVDAALEKVGMVVEGMGTAKALIEFTKKTNIEMPITQAVYSVIFEQKNPRNIVRGLMERGPKPEIKI